MRDNVPPRAWLTASFLSSIVWPLISIATGKGETLQERAARHRASNIILSRIKGRLWGEDLAIFYRVILELGLGEFAGFDATGGDENRSRDEAAIIKAFDVGNSERHEILGEKLNLIGTLPAALDNLSTALSMNSLSHAADSSAEEIAKARDDAKNALQIGLCLYEAFEWLYCEGAFGLRLIAWLARKAPDPLIDGGRRRSLFAIGFRGWHRRN
jgi:hypothetical protein